MHEVLMFPIKNLKRRCHYFLIFASLTFPLSSFALSSDAKQDMILKADKVTFNNKTKQAKYLGNVFLKQGTAKLNADTASSHLNKDNQLEKAIAHGSPLQEALFETLLDGQKIPLRGKADKITYLPQSQLVKLEGHALLTQGENTYKAPIIIYDMKNQRMLSHKTASHRTTIIFNEKTS